MLLLLLGLGGPLAIASRGHAGPFEDALPLAPDPLLRSSAREVLERAFDNLYGCDLAERVELVTAKGGEVVRRHEVTLARKRIDGLTHTLFDYRMGNEFYGLRSLRIERRRGSYDRFLFLPELGRVRRFGSAQRADQVLGTNLHFVDLEARRIDDFAIVGRSVETLGGERMHRLVVEPLLDLHYAYAEVWVEPTRYAIREVRYHRRKGGPPSRSIRAPSEEMVPFPDRVLPSHWIIEDHEAGVRTDVYFRRIRVGPTLADSLFSLRTLVATPRLPVFRD